MRRCGQASDRLRWECGTSGGTVGAHGRRGRGASVLQRQHEVGEEVGVCRQGAHAAPLITPRLAHRPSSRVCWLTSRRPTRRRALQHHSLRWNDGSCNWVRGPVRSDVSPTAAGRCQSFPDTGTNPRRQTCCSHPPAARARGVPWLNTRATRTTPTMPSAGQRQAATKSRPTRADCHGRPPRHGQRASA